MNSVRFFYLVVGIALVILSVATYAQGQTTISACGTTIASSGQYVLNQSINTTGHCITVNANNVSIDGQGFSITGDNGTFDYAIYSTFGIHRTNITIRNIVIRNIGTAVYFWGASNSTVYNVTVYHTTGHSLYFSGSNNTFSSVMVNSSNERCLQGDSDGDNTITNNVFEFCKVGIDVSGSFNNISHNNVTNGGAEMGISLNDASNFNNTVTGNLVSGFASNGFYLQDADNNTIAGNTIVDNGGGSKYGIEFYTAASNIFTRNNVSNNRVGMRLYGGGSNLIYNNIFNNDNNVEATPNANFLNTTLQNATSIIGKPTIGGNYWATPSGTGFSQTCTSAEDDGICDQNYTINAQNIDYHPLMDTMTQNITLLTGWNLISVSLSPA